MAVISPEWLPILNDAARDRIPDPQKLAIALRSDAEIPTQVRTYLADLLEEGRLVTHKKRSLVNEAERRRDSIRALELYERFFAEEVARDKKSKRPHDPIKPRRMRAAERVAEAFGNKLAPETLLTMITNARKF